MLDLDHMKTSLDEVFEEYRPHIRAAQDGKPLEFPPTLGKEPLATAETLYRTMEYLTDVQTGIADPTPTAVEGSDINSELLTQLLGRHLKSLLKIEKETKATVIDDPPADEVTKATVATELESIRRSIKSYTETISWLETWEPSIASGHLRSELQDGHEKPVEHNEPLQTLSAFCKEQINQESGYLKLSKKVQEDLSEVQGSVISATMLVVKLMKAEEHKKNAMT